ncbi:MAG: hypothetical protein J0I80_02945 [Sphingomonas sp.]|nr:hypothetical protein [Sphingomonas sp.]
MSFDDWWLIAIAAIFFLGFGLAGWLLPKHWLWRWADMIYYPLGAAGILLLFFSNDINRTLLRIEAEQAAAERAWRTAPNPRPELRFSHGSAELLAARYEWFEIVREHGDVCATLVDDDCRAYREYGEAVRAAFGDFTVPSTDDPVAVTRAEERFCSAALIYVTKLDAETTFSLGAFDKLKGSLTALSKGAIIDRVKTGLERDIAIQQAQFLGIIEVEYRALAERHMRLHRRHAVDLLVQLSWCATRETGNAESLKALDAWEAEEGSRARLRQQFARDLKAVRETKTPSALQQLSRMIQQQWWPYILVIALSIKFGKASAGVAEDISNGLQRLRSGIGRFTPCIPRFRWLRRRDCAESLDPEGEMNGVPPTAASQLTLTEPGKEVTKQ